MEVSVKRELTVFSLQYINLRLGLLPPRRHVIWRDSVGVESSRVGRVRVHDIFHQSFLWLLRHADEPQKGRNSCLWLQPRSVLSSFGVVLMSCKFNFHVQSGVRSQEHPTASSYSLIVIQSTLSKTDTFGTSTKCPS